MSTKNARTLSIRLDQTDSDALADFERRTGVDGVSLGRNALRACLAYFTAGGTITFPLHLTPTPPQQIEPIPGYLREDPPAAPPPRADKRRAS